jgi:hypothetical protein
MWRGAEENGKDHSEGPCEKWSITQSQAGKDVLHTIKRRKVDRIGHILRRDGLLKHAIQRMTTKGTEVTGT